MVDATGKTVKAVGPDVALSAFETRAGTLGHDGSRRLVTYVDGYWKHNPLWLDAVLTTALASTWTEYVQKTYMKYFVAQTDEIPTVVGDWLNFQNTLYDWRTGTSSAHSPDLAGTLQFGCELDLTGTAPKWQKFLDERVPAEAHELVQELAGYLLLWGDPFQVAVLLHGPGGSGKSTFLNVMRAMIGKGNTSATSLDKLTKNTFAISDLFGMTANICGDIDSTDVDRSAVFKSIVGNEEVRAERKGEQAFTFIPQAKLLFSANTLPKTKDKSDGWLRRWLFVPFPNAMAHEEYDAVQFEKELLDELPAIAGWAVQGLQRLMARGRFNPPTIMEIAKMQYRMDNDDVLEWLNENCELTPGAFTKGTSLWDDYTNWTFLNRMGRVPDMTSREFYGRIREVWKPPESRTIAGNAVHMGITLRPVTAMGIAV